MISRHRSSIRLALPAAAAAAILLFSHRASAFINVGGEVGLFDRSAPAPNDLELGLGYGLHGEIGLLPFITVGPYYLHYQLSGSPGAIFNVLGARARLTLPLPVIEPYGYVGVGYTWVSYDTPLPGDFTGNFVEIPLGVGVAYSIIPLLKGSLDFAYRPGSGFAGSAYDFWGITKPTGGFSVLLGIALDL